MRPTTFATKANHTIYYDGIIRHSYVNVVLCIMQCGYEISAIAWGIGPTVSWVRKVGVA